MGDYVVSARKYRPLEFDEVVGQEHITTTLHNAINNNKLAQALLFCGPRGVGKTTCARIVARLINGYENNEGKAMNIFELDAASHNSVDDIRSLTDQVRYPPQSGRYKVYIIDEVHMLSNAAFNAFLKTLEEPPSYAIFILATTEKHKVIPTILSRCQIFDFNRIQVSDIAQQLKKIAEREGIQAEDSALYLIAQKADGALRDALSMFDLMISFSANATVTFRDVIQNLHIVDYAYYFKVVDSLLAENPTVPLLLFDEIIKKGFDGRHFIVGLSHHIRNLLVAQDARTVALMEVPDDVKEHYLQQGNSAPPSLLLSWLNMANQCDIHYKESKNQRLTVELALMKMAHVHAAVSFADTEDTHRVKKKTKITTEGTTAPPVSPAAPPEKEVEKKPSEPISEPIGEPSEANPTTKKDPAASPEQNEKTTPDLRALVSSHQEIKVEEPDPPPPTHEGHHESVSMGELKKVWDEFAEQRKTKVGEYHMLKKPFQFSDNKVTLQLSNALEEPLLQQLKTALVSYLRSRLNNGRITVLGVVKTEESEKIAYTNREKFETLAKAYPALHTLKDKLGLDTDY